MYVLTFPSGRRYSLGEAQHDMAILCDWAGDAGCDPNYPARKLLADLERIACRGVSYSNEDFDLLSRAWELGETTSRKLAASA
jgi:hypothetical protein